MINESNRCTYQCVDWYTDTLVNVLMNIYWLVCVYVNWCMHRHSCLLYNTDYNNIWLIIPTRLPSPKKPLAQQSSLPSNIPIHTQQTDKIQIPTGQTIHVRWTSFLSHSGIPNEGWLRRESSQVPLNIVLPRQYIHPETTYTHIYVYYIIKVIRILAMIMV